MKRVIVVICAMLLLSAAQSARAEVKIGVGAVGPVSPSAQNDIVHAVAALPGVNAVWIQPPTDVDDAVKRFVAGPLEDRLDGVIVVSLPPESFNVQQDAHEAKFTGHYEIWTLNLSTLAEDHHQFTFSDNEPVVSGPASLLSIPAQLFVERATGQKVMSTNAWQAYEAIQARVEGKLVAATRLYLTTSPIRDTQPLNQLTCARQLVDRGDGDTALLVFKSAGVDNPEVRELLASAQDKLRHARAESQLGRTLGALASDDSHDADVQLAAYEKTPMAEEARAQQIRRALGGEQDHRVDTRSRAIFQQNVPGLGATAFAAMVSEMFIDQTGTGADDVIVSAKDVTVLAKDAPNGMKKHLDDYAAAVGKAAYLMSLKCGCDAGATVIAGPAGDTLLRGRFAPSLSKPEVGLP